MSRITLASGCALALAAILPLAAQAQTQAQTPRSEVVTVTDAALASPSGIAAVQSQIQRAAMSVCRVRGVRTLEARVQQYACAESAYADAMAQLQPRIALARAAHAQSLAANAANPDRSGAH